MVIANKTVLVQSKESIVYSQIDNFIADIEFWNYAMLCKLGNRAVIAYNVTVTVTSQLRFKLVFLLQF